jgi:uncharacterized protein (TIGR03118 family)
MKRKITLFIAAAALSGAVLVAAAFGDTSAAAPLRAQNGALVSLRQTGLGKVLVDARGRTLYLFGKDTRGRSACNAACAAYWPPLISSAKPRAGSGVRVSLLGVTKRTDGKRQVTYAGHPLYTFVGDTKAGQTNGEGLNNFGAVWEAVAASGRGIAPAASSSGSDQLGGGYGYGSGYRAAAASTRAQTDVYSVHALVSDAAAAPAADASLVNGWGLTAGPTTPWWAANNGTNTSTLYNGAGAKQALTVAVAGGPTGAVFNGSASDFVVAQNGKSGAARFLFATEGGTIMGWSPAVNANTAVAGADRSGSGAIYKGLAIANDKLFATDFHNGRVDVFDKSFNLVPGGFSDPRIPKGFAPFGIQALGGNIFVTYAKQDAAKKDDVPAPGQGFVDEFTPDGVLTAQVVNSGKTNAPLNASWGLALAPADFSVFGGDLLVGNFGNGRISAYTQRGSKWVFKGQLRTADGAPIVIDGLWAIAFGNGAAAGPASSLYFLSGPSAEKHGLFGSITAG